MNYDQIVITPTVAFPITTDDAEREIRDWFTEWYDDRAVVDIISLPSGRGDARITIEATLRDIHEMNVCRDEVCVPVVTSPQVEYYFSVENHSSLQAELDEWCVENRVRGEIIAGPTGDYGYGYVKFHAPQDYIDHVMAEIDDMRSNDEW